MVAVNRQLSGHRLDAPFTCGGHRNVVHQYIAADRGKETDIHYSVCANVDIETACAMVNVEYHGVDNFFKTPPRRLWSVYNIDGVFSLINHGGGKLIASAEDPAVYTELLKERAPVLYADMITCAAVPEAGKAHLPDRQSEGYDRKPATVNLDAKQPLDQGGIPAGDAVQV